MIDPARWPSSPSNGFAVRSRPGPVALGRVSACFFSANAPQRKSVANSCAARSIVKLCNEGRLRDAVDSLDLLGERGLRLGSHTLVFLLRTCARARALAQGKWVHLHLIRTSTHLTLVVSNHLIHMYAKCRSIVEARKVFDKMRNRNVFCWNLMLAGYAGVGLVEHARQLFGEMPRRDVVSWNTMLVALAQCGLWVDAVELFAEMRRVGVRVNQFSFAGVLIACVALLVVRTVRQLHAQALRAGFVRNTVVASSLVDGYAKCEEIKDARRLFDCMPIRDVTSWITMVSGYLKSGDVENARRLFDAIPEKNVFSWTAMIVGCAENGQGFDALDLLREMVVTGFRPDQFTYSGSLKGCSSILALKHGKQVHAHLLRSVSRPNIVVLSSLLDMYSNCGSLECGRRIFSGLRKMEIATCNTMFAAFARHGCGKEATELFEEMLKEGVRPDSVTFLAIIAACSRAGLTEEGNRIFNLMSNDHGVIPEREHRAHFTNLFAKSGCLLNQPPELGLQHREPV